MTSDNTADQIGPQSPGRTPFASPRCRSGTVARVTGHDEPFDGLYVRVDDVLFDRSFAEGEWLWRVRPLCMAFGWRATPLSVARRPPPLPWSNAVCGDSVLLPVGRVRGWLVMACSAARLVGYRLAQWFARRGRDQVQ